MDACDSPLVGICWDTGHANRNSDDQIPSIMRLGGRIKALHVNDNLGQTDLHIMPFLGNVPWEDVMHALYTWVYTQGLGKQQYSLTTAVGLLKSVLSCGLVLGTNALARKWDSSLW